MNRRPERAILPATLPLSSEQHAELTDSIWQQLILGRDDADEFIEIYAEDYDLGKRVLLKNIDGYVRL